MKGKLNKSNKRRCWTEIKKVSWKQKRKKKKRNVLGWTEKHFGLNTWAEKGQHIRRKRKVSAGKKKGETTRWPRKKREEEKGAADQGRKEKKRKGHWSIKETLKLVEAEGDSFAFIFSFKSSQKNYGEFIYVGFNF